MYHGIGQKVATSVAMVGLVAFGTLACATGAPKAPVSAPPASAPAVPAVDVDAMPPFFVPGESISWRVSFAGIEGSRARMAVGEVGLEGGHKVVVSRAEVQS